MSGRRRVLLINYEYPPLGGGAGTATRGIARAMARMGHDVVVLTSSFRRLPRREQVEGYQVVRVPVLRRRVDRANPIEMISFLASACLRIATVTRQWRPDLSIAFFTIPSGPVAWLLRRLRGVPFIVSLRGGDVPGFEWAPEARRYHKLTAPVVKRIWRHADAVVANSGGLRELASASTPELPIAVIPNGVDVPPAREPYHYPARILTIGRLTRQKGIDILLRALTQLRDLHWELAIAGDGPDRAHLEDMARTLGLADRVRFLGWVSREQMPGEFANTGIFVLASRIEGMPNVVLEAMAHARPVICTRVFGADDLVADGETGLLIDLENEHQLAEALRKLLSAPDLRACMGAAGRRRVESQFTWTATARSYLEIAERA